MSILTPTDCSTTYIWTKDGSVFVMRDKRNEDGSMMWKRHPEFTEEVVHTAVPEYAVFRDGNVEWIEGSQAEPLCSQGQADVVTLGEALGW